MLKILEDLVTLARERKSNPVKGSYTNKLLEDKSLAKEKVLEEINEFMKSAWFAHRKYDFCIRC